MRKSKRDNNSNQEAAREVSVKIEETVKAYYKVRRRNPAGKSSAEIERMYVSRLLSLKQKLKDSKDQEYSHQKFVVITQEVRHLLDKLFKFLLIRCNYFYSYALSLRWGISIL